MHRSVPCLLLAVTLALTGCERRSGPGVDPSAEPVEPVASSGATPPAAGARETAEPGATDAEVSPQAMVDAARADLAEHLGVPLDDVSVVRVREVTWADSALGCRERSSVALLSLQDGLQMELRAGGSTFWYHSALHGDPFRCERPDEPADVRD